jgi:hypothetical protein
MLMRKREGGQPDESSEVDYDLTCWYLNLRRVIELVGAEPFAPYLSAGHSLSQGGDQLHKLAALSTAKNALVEWFRSANPPTLGQLLASGELSNGSIFTHYASFYCKGLPAVRAALEKGKSSVPMAEAYAKLDDLKAGCRLSARFHHEHLTSTSAWHELSGQKQLFTLAVATEVSEDVIDAIPFVIASLFANLLDGNSSSVRSRWQRNLEVFVDAVDSFVRIRDNELRLSVHQLEPLRNLPEEEVKQAFAEIIGEPMIPRDWGGAIGSFLVSSQTGWKARSDGFRI